MDFTEKKHARYGLAVTILLHALLFILFLLYGLKVPVPLPDNSIVINFGTSADGTGMVQPVEAASSLSEPQPDPSEPSAVTSTPVQDVATQEAESPVSKPDEVKPKQDPQPEKEPERQVNRQALFPGKQTNQNSGGSEGETGKQGDQGDPSGDPNSRSHTGGLTGGGGNSYSLGMRKALHKPTRKPDCQETGKVVVTISVDPTGKVVKATPGGRGTTNNAACLIEVARLMALDTRWEADSDAPALQSGQIIYNFEVR